MDDDGGLGILPSDDEMAKKAEPKQPEPEPLPPTDIEVPAEWAEDDEDAPPETAILTLKTQVGQERRVAEMLVAKARKFKFPIFSLLAPAELRGYVFIETDDPLKAEKAVRGVSYARALIKDPNGQAREVPFDEIAHFLQPVSSVAKIAEGDIVELVSGPFRGEKAKVTRVDDAREEITVELIESMVPIPITVKGEHVRVLKRSEET